jgi:Fur family transcriptional regulator, ferric uptake regulator
VGASGAHRHDGVALARATEWFSGVVADCGDSLRVVRRSAVLTGRLVGVANARVVRDGAVIPPADFAIGDAVTRAGDDIPRTNEARRLRRRAVLMTSTGVRATRQRAAISRLLETLDGFRSAQELHDELRRRGETIGLTTVYRALQSMSAAGKVDTLRTDTGESIYRHCSDNHHHHLVCRSCGSTVEVGDCDIEPWVVQVAVEHGFSDVSYAIELFGTCAECRP